MSMDRHRRVHQPLFPVFSMSLNSRLLFLFIFLCGVCLASASVVETSTESRNEEEATPAASLTDQIKQETESPSVSQGEIVQEVPAIEVKEDVPKETASTAQVDLPAGEETSVPGVGGMEDMMDMMNSLLSSMFGPSLPVSPSQTEGGEGNGILDLFGSASLGPNVRTQVDEEAGECFITVDMAGLPETSSVQVSVDPCTDGGIVRVEYFMTEKSESTEPKEPKEIQEKAEPVAVQDIPPKGEDVVEPGLPSVRLLSHSSPSIALNLRRAPLRALQPSPVRFDDPFDRGTALSSFFPADLFAMMTNPDYGNHRSPPAFPLAGFLPGPSNGFSSFSSSSSFGGSLDNKVRQIHTMKSFPLDPRCDASDPTKPKANFLEELERLELKFPVRATEGEKEVTEGEKVEKVEVEVGEKVEEKVEEEAEEGGVEEEDSLLTSPPTLPHMRGEWHGQDRKEKEEEPVFRHAQEKKTLGSYVIPLVKKDEF